jgi:Cell wall-associated hydrolases (invasion-associated proteins)
MTTRADVVRVARSFSGTPYHHLGRLPGVGLDCAGVLICIGRELGLVAPDFDVPTYSPNPDGHSLIDWCDEFMGPDVQQEYMRPGDAIIVKVEKHPQHIAILGDYVHGGLSIIHSAMNATPPRVIETRLMFSRNLRFVAAYALPGIE